MEERLSILIKKVKNLPTSPGVYIMKSSNSKIIYIGKAKLLKKRVEQYFRSDVGNCKKTEKMVSNIYDFSYILTNNEFEALVLECSLIKKYKPKYNVLLRDDKGYSYVKITKEHWPRLFSAKQASFNNRTCEYLGPFTSSIAVKRSLDQIRKVFKLPICNKKFYDKNEEKTEKTRPCLYYYIKKCSAPCCGKIKHDEYLESFNEAINFLKSSKFDIVRDLTKKMNIASENLEFEKAAKLRDKIFALNQMKKRQSVVSVKIKNQDVIACVDQNNIVCFEVFKIRNGLLLDRETFFFKNVGDIKNVREEFLQQYYQNNTPPEQITTDEEIQNKNLICSWLFEKTGIKAKISTFKKGEQLRIIDICRNNAKESIFQKILLTTNEKELILSKLQKTLNLEKIPKYIESYDVSNIHGENNVGAMIVFKDGKPLKSSYRKFNINLNISGVFENKQDDYASMCQMINRRLNEYEKQKNLNEGFERLPDLILLDGGKGHVNCVKKLFKNRKYSIPIFGMSKNKKHKTQTLVNEKEEVNIKNDERLFLFISRIQDEVHRFAINFHRNKRKNKLTSTLLSIKGIGKTRLKILLSYFGSIENIKKASLTEIEAVPKLNKEIAKHIKEYFKL
ncbi:MAG: excinuclease ABC subunit UvrC [Oscillospiraceae bacterium]|nr:excinuclease ABC subunit UvrC [Oscillospiraceae bacterium]